MSCAQRRTGAIIVYSRVPSQRSTAMVSASSPVDCGPRSPCGRPRSAPTGTPEPAAAGSQPWPACSSPPFVLVLGLVLGDVVVERAAGVGHEDRFECWRRSVVTGDE